MKSQRSSEATTQRNLDEALTETFPASDSISPATSEDKPEKLDHLGGVRTSPAPAAPGKAQQQQHAPKTQTKKP